MFLQLLLWYLSRFSAVVPTHTFMTHTVHATEHLLMPIMNSTSQKNLPPHRESVKGETDALW